MRALKRNDPAHRAGRCAWPQRLRFAPAGIAVLDPAGNETRRISDPRFHSPWGLAFKGNSLLVTNGDLEPATNPDAWKIFKVDVGETGLPLNRPRTIGN
jgi:sugar lactone lactonase YvrE